MGSMYANVRFSLSPQLEEGVTSAMRCVDVETSSVDAEGIRRMLQEQHQKTHDGPDMLYFYHADHCVSREQRKLACFAEM